MHVVIRRYPSRWKALGGVAFITVAFLFLPCSHAAAAGPVDPCLTSLDGALCNDGNPCTKSDVCLDGVCTGMPAADGTVCTDGNLCTTMDQCFSGQCVGTAIPEGDPCDDGNKCTVGDRCAGGSCIPLGDLQCDDMNACTVDRCLPTRGCSYSLVPDPPPMCLPPMGGAGGGGGQSGAGGSGGSGGAGGGAGQTGFGGSGGQSSEGGSGGQGAGSFDAAVMEGGTAGEGGFGGFLTDSGVDGRSWGDADAGSDAAADSLGPLDPIGYEVQGGAVFCAYSPRSRGYWGGGPCLLVLGFGVSIFAGRRRRLRGR